MIDKNSVFYKKAKKMLDDFVASGGKVENLSIEDVEYKYIKNSKVFDDQGNLIDLESKFSLLGHSRARRYTKNLREDIKIEAQAYLDAGGSFHVERKRLPFYEKLNTYAKLLKSKGKNLTHEEIMKNDLGFHQYSEIYYRCKDVELLKQFVDENGYVDSYRKDEKLKSFISDLSITFNVPYYFIITLLADLKLSSYEIKLDYVKYLERKLQNYAKKNKSFVGIKRNDEKLYEAFCHLIDHYSDGTGIRFSKKDWLFVFGLNEVENRFKDVEQIDIDIDDIMNNLKEKHQNKQIKIKDISTEDYRKILRKSILEGVSVLEIFKSYGLSCSSINIPRLSKVRVDEIPYAEEIKKRMQEVYAKVVSERKQKTKLDKLCKEEMFEEKVKAMQQVYAEFKEKIENYLPEDELSDIYEMVTNNI